MILSDREIRAAHGRNPPLTAAASGLVLHVSQRVLRLIESRNADPGDWSLVMYDRITFDPTILGGKPIIRGTRISVEIILEWLASGATREDIVRKHPRLSAPDVQQALDYAASAVRNEVRITAEVPG